MLEPFALTDSYYTDVTSSERRRDYRLFVGGFAPDKQNLGPRDVFVVVDGNWLFPLVAEHIRMLSLFTPMGANPLVIGIGYPTDDNSEIMGFRNADMALSGPTGGVRAFMDFVGGTVTKWLKNELGVSAGNRYLAGHSWGGSFALLNLLSDGMPFDGYLASSPVVTGTVLESLVPKIGDLDRRTKLFYSIGTAEYLDFPAIKTSEAHLSSVIGSAENETLKIRREVFQGEDHTSVATFAMAKGIQFLLSS